MTIPNRNTHSFRFHRFYFDSSHEIHMVKSITFQYFHNEALKAKNKHTDLRSLLTKEAQISQRKIHTLIAFVRKAPDRSRRFFNSNDEISLVIAVSTIQLIQNKNSAVRNQVIVCSLNNFYNRFVIDNTFQVLSEREGEYLFLIMILLNNRSLHSNKSYFVPMKYN